MEPRQLAETRYDVFLSAHGREDLFHQQGAENVVGFLRNYLVDKIGETWLNKGERSNLGVFWGAKNAWPTWNEFTQVWIQKMRGRLVFLPHYQELLFP